MKNTKKPLKSFKEFVELQEKLVTFNNKAYPRFGNIVILAGGAGSGKGFVIQNMLGIDGKILDVDEVKRIARMSSAIATRIKKETGEDISKFDLRNPENVKKLHFALNSIIKSRQSTLEKSIINSHPERLPNVIFDVTLREFPKLEDISKFAEVAGYPKENIHLVWVVNDAKVALKQNAARARVVPEEILLGTHTGVAKTIKDLISLGSKASRFINGDIWIVFNNKDKDDAVLKKSDKGGAYIKHDSKIKIKNAGNKSIKQIPAKILDKITQYTGTKIT